MSERNFFKAFGPGLLFAGAAVGVSHLVQSTRAGAQYGIALILIILVANVLKYPAFSFGPRYAAATGTSLLEGYRRQGKWALILYGILTIGTMFTVMAAVTVVTAGLAKTLLAALGVKFSIIVLCAIVLAICGTICGVGDFRWLDRVMKVVVVTLTVATLEATVLILKDVNFSGPWWPTDEMWDAKTILFIAALVGWMPSAIDVAVWQSLWTLAKRKSSGYKASVKDAMIDFKVGYIGTALLAFCFLFLGAAVMHDQGIQIANKAGAFAGQVVRLYAHALGDWSIPVIGTAAFLVMFSTTLTVMDGFPRALACLKARFSTAEEADGEASSVFGYRLSLIVLIVGSLGLLISVLRPKASGGSGFGFKDLIDLATTLSFITAPMLAFLNHRAITSDAVPEKDRPGTKMIMYSLACIVFLSLAFFAWLEARFEIIGLFAS